MSSLNPLVDHSKRKKSRELKEKGAYSYLDEDRKEKDEKKTLYDSTNLFY